MAEDNVEDERGERKGGKEEEPSNHLKQPRHGALNVFNLVHKAWKERRPGGGAAAAAIAVVVVGVAVVVVVVVFVFVVGGDAIAAAAGGGGG